MDLCRRLIGLVDSGRHPLKSVGKFLSARQHRVGDTITNDGTGYRLSLIVALVLCIFAALVFRFYDEDAVMGRINAAKEENFICSQNEHKPLL